MALYSALITGANRGIGLKFVVDLLKQNPTHLIATARDLSKATELNELASKNSNLHLVQLEMTDYAHHDAFVAEIDRIVGEKGLQLLVQNAGMTIRDDEGGLEPENIKKVFDVNAVSPILLTKKFMPLLRRSAAAGNRTLATFIGSFLGSIELNVDSRVMAYRMSKCALNQGVRTITNLYKDEPVHFVVLHPGHVQTDMGTNHGKVKAPVTKEESVQGMLKYLNDDQLVKDGRVLTWEGKLLPW